MGFRFEFDPAHKVLITRVGGELTDELIRNLDAEMRKRLLEKNPSIHIHRMLIRSQILDVIRICSLLGEA